MALYIPAGARRRRLVLGVLAGLVVGLVLGVVLGRSSAPSIDERVASVRAHASGAAISLRRLPIEYEQSLADTGGESTATITAAIDAARARLDQAYEQAVWLGPDAGAATDRALEAVERAVADRVDVDQFQLVIDDAVAAIDATFVLEP